ncbi:Microcin C7 self-immunity protein MccF [Vibrio aerogenes CECT 7868]|uniref:Microcin C7 self-immunity protein MccF n=1 Tax=Vibrio aerogenes CECT 7868 TaxID=1216006 RepID=A0A1M5ZTK8_9VIBR|nr:S66 peptidase family protein [Vibrio aerogenes]SHI27466.1 Microcin C7 self-immunity protein MccF [Vibrio aerogenes CECT 7868]
MKYPRPLQHGSTIAITAFSAGIAKQHLARFQVVRENLLSAGFNVIAGECLYGQTKHVSAPARQRADELMSFLLDDNIDAIYPPWGGEIAIELLPLLDFEQLQKVRPKWILGFSDISTMTAVLTAKLGWATVHCSNLMDLTPKATDPLTSHTLKHLATATGESFTQTATTSYATDWPDFVTDPTAGFRTDQPTRWQWLVKPHTGTSIQGRLIGGCWDTMIHLFDTPFLDLKMLAKAYPEGLLLYLENAEMSPPALVRAIHNMKFRGVFSVINGLLLGRSAAAKPLSEQSLHYHEVLSQYLTDLGIPVIIDMDIGHQPPNLTLINGATATVRAGENAVLHQTLN